MLGEPEFNAKERRVYGETLDALDRSEVRYMLGGALALNAYTGIWRDTKDLDIFVAEETVSRVLKVLEKVGFKTDVEDPVWLAKGWRGDLYVDIIHSNDNGTEMVDESWYENAREITILGREALVMPPEELIISKIFVAFRDRSDLSDVLHVIFARRGDLDWERIVRKLDRHLELLLSYLHLYRYVYPSHAHHVPSHLFDSIDERCRKDLKELREGPPRFRGTMLDDFSFDVDVKEWDLPDERAAIREERLS